MVTCRRCTTTGRGLTEKRLRALPVIHNYGLKRADGTMAAMRLFGKRFPICFYGWLQRWMNLLCPEMAAGVLFVTL